MSSGLEVKNFPNNLDRSIFGKIKFSASQCAPFFVGCGVVFGLLHNRLITLLPTLEQSSDHFSPDEFAIP